MTEQDAQLLALMKQRINQPQEVALALTAQDLGLSPIRAAQRLNRIIDTQDAAAADPVTVRILRSRREGYSMNRYRRNLAR